MFDFITQQKIKQGDVAAFEHLFKESYAPLCRYAASIVNDNETAEEIVSDFFYNYWKSRTEISIQISLKSYIYKAVKNNALRHLQTVIIRQRHAESVLHSAETIGITVEDEVIANELNQQINETLKQLPKRCATIFMLSKFEGKKYSEIAQQLSISIKTVEADMSKALRLIRKNIGTITTI